MLNDERKIATFVKSFPVSNVSKECDRPSSHLDDDESNNDRYKNNFRTHIHYNGDFKFAVCLIEKVGCSFFKRFLYFFRGHDHNLTNPFDLSLNRAHTVHLDTFKGLTDIDIKRVLQSHKKFIFVRDPYSRLFSGYVDKLFSRCNTWRSYNRLILKKIGRNTVHRECANDVTFEEFVMYFVQAIGRGDYVDGHFVPMYRHCKPCQIKYDFIGKLENFDHDIRTMMHLTGLSNYTYLLQKSKEASVQDELEDVSNILFKKQPTSQNSDKCFDSYKAAIRQWRKLQIKGILSLKIPFPYSQSMWKNVDSIRFHNMLFIIHQLSKGIDSTMQENRRKAMVEAYQSLPSETLEKLKTILEPDCKLFGYDVNPTFLDEKQKILTPQFIDFRLL